METQKNNVPGMPPTDSGPNELAQLSLIGDALAVPVVEAFTDAIDYLNLALDPRSMGQTVHYEHIDDEAASTAGMWTPEEESRHEWFSDLSVEDQDHIREIAAHGIHVMALHVADNLDRLLRSGELDRLLRARVARARRTGESNVSSGSSELLDTCLDMLNQHSQVKSGWTDRSMRK